MALSVRPTGVLERPMQGVEHGVGRRGRVGTASVRVALRTGSAAGYLLILTSSRLASRPVPCHS